MPILKLTAPPQEGQLAWRALIPISLALTVLTAILVWYTGGRTLPKAEFKDAVLFFLMCIGGCTGSTSGGIKIFRITVLHAIASNQIARLVRPHGVFVATFNGRPLPDTAAVAVMAFVFMFGLSFALLAMTLSALGLDYLTAMSGAVTALANVGPGLGDLIGPAGNFSSLPDSAKWLLSAAMLLGRLELFTVLILLTPAFWRG